MNNGLDQNITITTISGGTDGVFGNTGGTSTAVTAFANITQMDNVSILRNGLDADYDYFIIKLSYMDIAKTATITYNSKVMQIKKIVHDEKLFFTTVTASYGK